MMIGIKDFTMPKNCGECRCYDVEWARCSFLDKDMEGIDKRPTDCPLVDDVEPVNHACWIGLDVEGYADGCPVYDTWRCSNCLTEFWSEGEPPSHDRCPNCGARMNDN